MYALVPTLGTVLIVLFATQQTTVGTFVGNKVFVSVGLISYSAYLWHQPLFAFARHMSLSAPSHAVFLMLLGITLIFAYLSWKYVESPFRHKRQMKRENIFLFAILGSSLFACFGLLGTSSNGFKLRFSEIRLPNHWNPPIQCHGGAAISRFENPLNECLGTRPNGIPGDIYLLGDSHAAQITFPLKAIAKERKTDFYFINTEDTKDFPYSFFNSDLLTQERIFDHILLVADRGDFVIVSFHRGQLNEARDKHLPLTREVNDNEKYRFFIRNMNKQMKKFAVAGVRVVLVKDAPLLSDTSSIEKCAYLKIKYGEGSNYYSVKLEQDLHTRMRQSKAFDDLASLFPTTVTVVDPIPILYGEQRLYSPINYDGTYRMFDRHHLTESEALKLIDIFRSKIQ